MSRQTAKMTLHARVDAATYTDNRSRHGESVMPMINVPITVAVAPSIWRQSNENRLKTANAKSIYRRCPIVMMKRKLILLNTLTK